MFFCYFKINNLFYFKSWLKSWFFVVTFPRYASSGRASRILSFYTHHNYTSTRQVLFIVKDVMHKTCDAQYVTFLFTLYLQLYA